MSVYTNGTATVLDGLFQKKYQANEKSMNEALVRNSHVMCGVKYGELPVAQLLVDKSYQREARGKVVNSIASNWNIFKCKAIEVSYRDGKFYVINGQHRTMAARIVGEEFLPCQIYINLTMEQEALLFAEQLDNVSRLTTTERMAAEVAGKDPDAIAVNDICSRYSIIIDKPAYGATGALRGLNTVQRIYRIHGEAALVWIFNIIKHCGWHNVKGGYGDAVISSLRNIYLYHKDELYTTSEHLVRLFERTNPDIIIAQSSCSFVGRGITSALTAYLEKCLEAMDDSIPLAM